MAYTKHTGVIRCKFIGSTPLWIDAINVNTGAEMTVFVNKMSDKFAKSIKSSIISGRIQWVVLKKMKEDDCYRFLMFSQGQVLRNKAKKRIAIEGLEREIDKDYNPAKGKSRQKLLTGRKGLPTSKRTGTRITRAITRNINTQEKS